MRGVLPVTLLLGLAACGSTGVGEPTDAGDRWDGWLQECQFLQLPCVEGSRCFDRGENVEKVCTGGIPQCGRRCDKGEFDTGSGVLPDAEVAGDAGTDVQAE